MKKTLILTAIFLVYTIAIISCPIIDLWDKDIILYVQKLFNKLPLWIPLLPDCKLYSIMIAIPLIAGSIWFFKKRMYKNIVFLCSIPLVTFLLNCIIKPLVHRARPPFEFQLAVHPQSFSYVSSHSLVTFCLWGVVIYLINKYCQNEAIRKAVVAISVLWIVFVGTSRIWLGVHHLSDVLAAYLLGYILVSLYIKIFQLRGFNE